MALSDDAQKNARKAIRLSKEVAKKDFKACASQAVNALESLSERNTDALEDCVKLARKEGKLIKDLTKARQALRR
jgi:hypothetical protein